MQDRAPGCRNHADRRAEALCARCGDFVCGLCAVSVEGVSYCPICLVKARGDAVHFGTYLPWEDRARLGTIPAALQMIGACFSRPQELFDRMPMEGGYTDPLLFGMLIRGTVAVVLSILIAGFYVIVGLATREPAMFLQAGVQAAGMVFNVLQAAVILFIMSGILHLAVLIVAAGKGFERTFRVYSYAQAISIVELIPLFGLLFSTAYSVYLYFLGMKAAHDLSNGQALGVALVPIGLYFAMVFFIFALALLVIILIAAVAGT